MLFQFLKYLLHFSPVTSFTYEQVKNKGSANDRGSYYKQLEKPKEIPLITVTFVIMKYFLAHPLLHSFLQ